MIRAYLLDDEPLAVRRLERMLAETGGPAVVGASSDPEAALAELPERAVDVLFLDIQMPELDGFAFLARLPAGCDPLVAFVTAFSEHALRAFEVNSAAYLVKPVAADALERALRKVERAKAPPAAPREPLADLVTRLQRELSGYPTRIASKFGDRVEFIDLSRVTHFYAEDKVTLAAVAAAAAGKAYVVDATIADLEARLDPRRFIRVHRSTLVNLDFVQEMFTLFAGKALLRLKDPARTETTVARERVKELRERLGI